MGDSAVAIPSISNVLVLAILALVVGVVGIIVTFFVSRQQRTRSTVAVRRRPLP